MPQRAKEFLGHRKATLGSDVTSLTILLVGDATRAEFCDVLPLLQASAEVRAVSELERAEANAPDLCIVLQATPGEFPPDVLEATLRRWPLTRLVTVAGSLAEGEPRSGQPWQGQVRVYWHEFPGWWKLQHARWSAGLPTEWSLPRTSREDDLLRQLAPIQWPQLRGPLGVAAARWGHAPALLMKVLGDHGISACWLATQGRAEVVGLQAILWDDDDPDGVWRESISALSVRWSHVPLLALRSFPRVADRDWLESYWNASTSILAKPFDVDVLLATLASCIAPPARILT